MPVSLLATARGSELEQIDGAASLAQTFVPPSCAQRSPTVLAMLLTYDYVSSQLSRGNVSPMKGLMFNQKEQSRLERLNRALEGKPRVNEVAIVLVSANGVHGECWRHIAGRELLRLHTETGVVDRRMQQQKRSCSW